MNVDVVDDGDYSSSTSTQNHNEITTNKSNCNRNQGRGLKRPKPTTTPVSSANAGSLSFQQGCGGGNNIEESFKKIRIGRTAGEFRLAHDLKECQATYGGPPTAAQHTTSAHGYWRLRRLPSNATPLEFDFEIWNEVSQAWIGFHCQVPKYYPHSPPIVHRIIIGANTPVPLKISKIWSPINSLVNVIEELKQIVL